MKKRVRVSQNRLQAESFWITQFVLSEIVPDTTRKGVAIAVIFQKYKEYLKREKLGRTELSIDGFGRLFPKTFSRRCILHKGKLSKGVEGVRLA